MLDELHPPLELALEVGNANVKLHLRLAFDFPCVRLFLTVETVEALEVESYLYALGLVQVLETVETLETESEYVALLLIQLFQAVDALDTVETFKAEPELETLDLVQVLEALVKPRSPKTKLLRSAAASPDAAVA